MAAKFQALDSEFKEQDVIGIVVAGAVASSPAHSWEPWKLKREAEGLYEEELYFLLKKEVDDWSAWAKQWLDVIATAGVPLGQAILYVERAIFEEASRRWLLSFEKRITQRFDDVEIHPVKRRLIETELKAVLKSGSNCPPCSPDDRVRWKAGVDGEGEWIRTEDEDEDPK